MGFINNIITLKGQGFSFKKKIKRKTIKIILEVDENQYYKISSYINSILNKLKEYHSQS